MDFPFYAGDGRVPPSAPPALQKSRQPTVAQPRLYRADPGLAAAANVALLLGQPLLLTGEPGVGKTEFAYSLACELGFEAPLKFETKSTSTARDLFYTYDAIKRFQDAHGEESIDPRKYITFNALGLAILRARNSESQEHFQFPEFADETPRRSVVLIDEIDKAPRDFPNDLLNELEHMSFRIPELNVSVAASDELSPIVVITSNSEKDLPNAFLRRCIYYNIPFPDLERLNKIVANRLGTNLPARGRLRSAIELFHLLRAPDSGLRKKPATAELLGWLSVLARVEGGLEADLVDSPDLITQTLSSLTKTTDDHARAREIVQKWIASKRNA